VGTFKLGLVVTCQVNGSSPFNVPDMFPPISRGPCPQCILFEHWLAWQLDIQVILLTRTYFAHCSILCIITLFSVAFTGVKGRASLGLKSFPPIEHISKFKLLLAK